MANDTTLTGDRLRIARIEAGYRTAKDFYEKFNIKPSTYSAHESGRNPLSIKTAKKYGKLLNISPSQLLTGDEKHQEDAMNKYVLHYGQVPRDTLLNKMLNEITVQFIKSSGIKPGMKIAEFGCGTGSISCWLAEYVGETGQVYAIDRGYEQISITKRRAAELHINNLECIRSEITEKPLNINADLIYMRCFLHHTENPQKIIQMATESLTKNGILICIEPIMSSFWAYPDIFEMQKALDLYMKLGEINNLDFDIGRKLQNHLSSTNALENFQTLIHHGISLSKFDKSWIEMITSECAIKYIEKQLITDSEMDNILSKINQHLNNENTIATLPAFVFVSAKKR